MNPAVHIVCPDCQAVNRVQPEHLALAPDCGRCKKPLFQGKPVDLDGAGFERHLARSDIPVLVDFWAAWCGPCRMMAPAFEQAAIQLEPAFRVVKVDTERAQELAGRLQIRSIPTLALFRGGQEIARQAGAMTRAADIVAWARAHA